MQRAHAGQDVQHSIIKQQFNERISISSFLYSSASPPPEKWKKKVHGEVATGEKKCNGTISSLVLLPRTR
jgi:hypothetical protein